MVRPGPFLVLKKGSRYFGPYFGSPRWEKAGPFPLQKRTSLFAQVPIFGHAARARTHGIFLRKFRARNSVGTFSATMAPLSNKTAHHPTDDVNTVLATTIVSKQGTVCNACSHPSCERGESIVDAGV